MRSAIVASICFGVFGCLRTTVENGALKCATDSKRQCPVGYYCAPDDTCWKDGSTYEPAPDMSDGGGADMAPDTCSNGALDSGETDIDCGGPCPACSVGKMCMSPADCASQTCTSHVCTPAPTCTDGMKDGMEADVDCGAACPNKCAVDKSCGAANDCSTNDCFMSRCTLVSGPPFWVPAAALPANVQEAAAATGPDGRLYVMGGNFGTVTTFAYTPSTDSWVQVADMQVKRAGAASVTGGDGKIYAIGGYSLTDGDSLTVETYTPNVWSLVMVGNHPAASHKDSGAVAGLDGNIYAVGGNSDGAVEVFNGTWSLATHLPTPRISLGVALGSDGRIYAIGGQLMDGTETQVVEAFDTSTKTWSAQGSLAMLPTKRQNFGTAAAPDGRIYVVAGQDASGNVLGAVEAYSPAINRWVTTASFTRARENVTVAVGSDGRLYAVGGYSNGNTNFVDAYGPQITATPAMAAKGATVAVSGSNFGANAWVSIYWGSETAGMLLGTGSTDSTGALTSPITITIPNVAAATYKLVAVDDRSEYPINRPFAVTP